MRDSSSSAAFASSSCLPRVCFIRVSWVTFPSASSSCLARSAFSLCERDLNALRSSSSRADCSNLAFNSANCDSRFFAIFSAWPYPVAPTHTCELRCAFHILSYFTCRQNNEIDQTDNREGVPWRIGPPNCKIRLRCMRRLQNGLGLRVNILIDTN